MSRFLEGDELDAFMAALERAAVEFTEVMQIARRQPESVEDWRRTFCVLAEAFTRHGEALADMVTAATGADARPCFLPGQPEDD